MRGTLTILVVVAVIAAGLWYWLAPADTPAVTRPETPEPAGATTPATGHSQTADSGTTAPADVARATESGASESARQSAAVEPADDAAAGEIVLSPVPESTVEQVPIATPATDEPRQTDLLASVERVVEQVETAIRERLGPESGEDTDTKPRARMEHDDPQQGGADTPTPTVPALAAGSASAPDVARAATDEATEAEAKQYVETLTAAAPQTIPVDKAAHFATREQVLSLVPEDTIERVSVAELAKDDTLAAEAPITVVREVEQTVKTAVPEQLVAESGGDLDTRVRVLTRAEDSPDDTERNEAGQEIAAGSETVEKITVREALERLLAEPEKPISIIKTVRYFEVTTLRELLGTEGDTDTLLDVVRRPYRIETATLADLLERQKAENPDSIFYLHTVRPTDEQGIWGIVQFGLMDNFARGMAIRRGEDTETYTVRIPRDADERLHDQSSSFLGKLIDRKTKESFVYNFREDRMGRNPDRIHPGQEIVIINFEPQELVSIYRHFASG